MSWEEIIRKSFGYDKRGTVFMCNHCGYESLDSKEWNEQFPIMLQSTDKSPDGFALFYRHTCPKCNNTSSYEFGIIEQNNSRPFTQIEDRKYNSE